MTVYNSVIGKLEDKYTSTHPKRDPPTKLCHCLTLWVRVTLHSSVEGPLCVIMHVVERNMSPRFSRNIRANTLESKENLDKMS